MDDYSNPKTSDAETARLKEIPADRGGLAPVVVVDPDAVYVVIARHVHKVDFCAIWTGVLGWVPLTDAIPAQLLSWKQADDLRKADTTKFRINVVRVIPPTNKRSVIVV